ncbi:MAG: BrnA antitoxin family protein [Thermodesulfobacteriota bacterium]|nr:BrnA antitoxin family protein [Thermodesulfobacteriota bacterium]
MSDIIKPSDQEDLRINKGIAADTDTFEASDSDFANMQRVAKAHPHIPRRVRGSQKKTTKQSTTIRMNAEVLAFFKSHGTGWQAEINAVLQHYVDEQLSNQN